MQTTALRDSHVGRRHDLSGTIDQIMRCGRWVSETKWWIVRRKSEKRTW
jgi:hypothetical protein